MKDNEWAGFWKWLNRSAFFYFVWMARAMAEKGEVFPTLLLAVLAVGNVHFHWFRTWGRVLE